MKWGKGGRGVGVTVDLIASAKSPHCKTPHCAIGSGSAGFVHGENVSASQIANHLLQMHEIGVTVPLSYL